MQDHASASQLMQSAESARAAAGLSQQQLALALGMTQGHYSKLAAGRVPPGTKAVAAISEWLTRQEANPPDSDARRAELRRLADDIAMQCIRLTALATSS